MQAHTSNANRQQSSDFHGAALIDQHGREVPITEAMVQQACKHLENSWLYPVNARQAG